MDSRRSHYHRNASACTLRRRSPRSLHSSRRSYTLHAQAFLGTWSIQPRFLRLFYAIKPRGRSLSSLGIALLVLLITVVLPCSVAHAGLRELVVAVTHPSLAAVVKAVGGERVRVVVLIPQGVDPHHYEPSPAELLDLLRDARVVVMTGPSHLPIEERIEELYESGLYGWVLLTYRDYSGEGLELLEIPSTGRVNPHEYSLSLRGLKSIARSLYKALAGVDPEGADYYEQRLREYLGYLDRLSGIADSARRRLGAVRIGLLTPLLQYAIADAGLELGYVVVVEHGLPVEIKQVLDTVEAYGRSYDVLVVSDIELAEYRGMVEELARRGIRVVAVPVSPLIQESPELVPLVVSLSLLAPQLEAERGTGQSPSPYPYVTAALLIMLTLAILLVFALRARSRGAAGG